MIDWLLSRPTVGPMSEWHKLWISFAVYAVLMWIHTSHVAELAVVLLIGWSIFYGLYLMQ